MTRRFKSIKKHNILFIPIMFFNIYLLFKIINFNLKNIKIYKSSDKLINSIIDNNSLFTTNNIDYINLVNNFSNFEIKNPVSIIKNTINYNTYYLDNINSYLYNYKKIINPTIFLYSSFDKELLNNQYNMDTNILILYILKGILAEYNIKSNVLDVNIKELGELNNKNVYEVSRLYLDEMLNKIEIKLFIDIQIGNNESITINNQKYSKINFMVNSNYLDNLELANKLNKIISKDYKGLINDSIEVESNINEDLKNVLVIQIGSSSSSLEEIYNTLWVLGTNIKKLMGEIDG